jgi:tRNA(adenine34) deaminase
MMARAIARARTAGRAGEVPVGAVIYETASGRVLSEAHNTRENDRDPAGHAEFLAIAQACRARKDWRLDDCTLVVTLEPCAMCAGLIVNARVGRVIYGAPDPKAGFAGSLGNLLTDERLNHRVRPIAGVCQEECGQMLREFFAKRREAKKSERKARERGRL